MRTRAITIVAVFSVLAATSLATVSPQTRRTESVKGGETAVTLKKRTGSGAYGASAYSLRYATQDAKVHRNAVDLIFNSCGLVHIRPGSGSKNRIMRVEGRTLADVRSLPQEGDWLTECFEPESGALYAMQIDDGSTRMLVKLHVTGVTDDEIRLVWSPLQDLSRGAAGTMGTCSGPHAAR